MDGLYRCSTICDHLIACSNRGPALREQVKIGNGIKTAMTLGCEQEKIKQQQANPG